MAGEEFIFAIPEELSGSMSLLLTTLQAAGWAIIFYIIFMVINTLLNRRRNEKIEEVLGQVNRMVHSLEEIKKLLSRSNIRK
jgi:hypothetical protein